MSKKQAVYRDLGTGLDTRGFHHSLFELDKLPAPLRLAFEGIEPAAREPFIGVTTDGEPLPGLFELKSDGTPARLVEAARAFLAGLPSDQRHRASLPLDDHRRRLWCNAFMPFEPHGILLEEADAPVREALVALIAATFSEKGHDDARRAMQLNELLGRLIGDGRRNLTEWMYWVTIFGEPSAHQPWGWQLYGHHLDINVTVVGGQIVMTPFFIGAEPRISDDIDGPYADLRIFDAEETQGIAFMRSLRPEQRERATLYRSMLPADLPEALAGPFDGRHRGGAGRDNLVLPYEGIAGAKLDETQRRGLIALVDLYIGRLPERQRADLIEVIERYIDETWFAWIGAVDDDLPFYYRVHGPTILIEFDHHVGIFLDNAEPDRIHTHTIIRTPNGNDYGMALLRQHRDAVSSAGSRSDLLARRDDLEQHGHAIALSG